jgi:hypothetical protein
VIRVPMNKPRTGRRSEEERIIGSRIWGPICQMARPGCVARLPWTRRATGCGL